MNLKLERRMKLPDGIFSAILNPDGDKLLVALEHAYEDGQGGYDAKIPPGRYTCVRGRHRLEGMTEDFETFEVTGVEGHTGLLFHWGNYNRDSHGCILTGEKFVTVPISNAQTDMVTNSRAAFAFFMKMQTACDQFELEVE